MILRADLAVGYSWGTWYCGVETGKEGNAKTQWKWNLCALA